MGTEARRDEGLGRQKQGNYWGSHVASVPLGGSNPLIYNSAPKKSGQSTQECLQHRERILMVKAANRSGSTQGLRGNRVTAQYLSPNGKSRMPTRGCCHLRKGAAQRPLGRMRRPARWQPLSTHWMNEPVSAAQQWRHKGGTSRQDHPKSDVPVSLAG